MALIAGEGGRIVRVNAALCAGLGRAEAELRGTLLLDLVAAGDRGQAAAALGSLVAPGDTATFETATVRKHGGARRMRWHSGRSLDGAHLFVHLLDIIDADAERETLSTERRLRRSEQLLRALLDNVPVILWTVDQKGVFTQSDGIGLRALGRAPGEAVGHSVFETYGKLPGVTEAIRGALAGETRFLSVGVGRAMWDCNYIPLRDGDTVTEVLGLALDVSDRHDTEKELRRRLELIEAQRNAIRALSMPIIQVSDGVLALPIIGVVDGERASLMTEALLESVVQTRARHVILDLTGVGSVEDARTADHLFRMVAALSLVGARAVVTGIQPAVAQAIVSLGIDLSRVLTASNLKDGIRLCTQRGAEHHG